MLLYKKNLATQFYRFLFCGVQDGLKVNLINTVSPLDEADSHDCGLQELLRGSSRRLRRCGRVSHAVRFDQMIAVLEERRVHRLTTNESARNNPTVNGGCRKERPRTISSLFKWVKRVDDACRQGNRIVMKSCKAYVLSCLVRFLSILVSKKTSTFSLGDTTTTSTDEVDGDLGGGQL